MANQERLKPQEERNQADRDKARIAPSGPALLRDAQACTSALYARSVSSSDSSGIADRDQQSASTQYALAA